MCATVLFMPRSASQHDDYRVRLTTPRDYSFVASLQRRYSADVGFVCHSAWRRYIDDGRCILCLSRGQPAGYVLFNPCKTGLVRFLQIAISPELLRSKLGTLTMNLLEHAARTNNCSVIRGTARLHSLGYLFCQAYNFTPTAVFNQPTTRHLPRIEWTYPLVTTPLHQLTNHQHAHTLTPTAFTKLPSNPRELPTRPAPPPLTPASINDIPNLGQRVTS